jgi:diguanylate cyclase
MEKVMFGKKSSVSDDSKSAELQSETAGLWGIFNRRVSEILSTNKVDLRTLPAISIQALVDTVIHAKTAVDLRVAFDKLQSTFEQARSQETLHLNQYILGLRSLLWSSLNQVMDQMSVMNKESEQLDGLRDKMVRALDSDDLLQLKLAVKDWVVLQNSMSQERKRLANETQTNYQHQLSRLQNELYLTQTELKLDGLTQVYNRKAFDSEIAKTLQIAQLSGRTSCLLLFDIDHFKHVNDTYGHPIGDKVLQHFAKLIVQNFPSRTDFVARYGGEEFVVIMSDCDLKEASEKAQRFVSLLRKTTMTFGTVSLRITVSIGIAGSRPFEKTDNWIKRADVLLYQAKEEGRDCYIVDVAAA